MLTLEYSLSDLARLLPFPPKKANKYTRGKLTIVGGSQAYPGAASLAAIAAQEMGAGYVEVLCAPESANVIRCTRPSLVVRPWNDAAALASLHADDEGHHKNPRAYLMGPGIDAHEPVARDLVYTVLEQTDSPVIIDGGAITAVATVRGMQACADRAQRKSVTVMTPHMGEASRLAEQARISTPSPNAAEGSLANFAYSLAEAYAASIILKGPTTYLASPSSDKNELYVVRQGTSALAKAGTGDVLAGMVGALFAQQTESLKANYDKACALAVTLHAFAGRIAAEKKTDISVCAEDLLENIYSAIRYLLEFV